MQSFKANTQLIWRGYKEAYSFEPKLIIFSILQGMFQAVMPFVSLFFTSWILNILFVNPSFEELTPVIAMTLIASFASALLANGLDHYRIALIYQARDKKDMKLNNKVIFMDYEFIEKSDVHEMRNNLDMAELTGGQGIFYIFSETKRLVSQLFTLLISIGFVLSLFFAEVPEESPLSYLNSPWFLIGTVIGYVLYYMYASKLYKRVVNAMYSMLEKGAHTNNIYGFIMGQLMDYQSGKEIRLYKQQKLYDKVFDNMSQMTYQSLTDMQHEENKGTIVLQTLIHLVLGLGFLYSALKAIGGAILPGSIVIYTGAISNFVQTFPELVSETSRLYNNHKFLGKYFEFLELKSVKHEGTLPVEKRVDNEYELEVRNVSFKYPGTEDYVLKNINLKLTIGEKMAIVGMNGSGKTTFIKLLTRLYDPTEGEILLNGIDIRKYDYDEYLQLFSVVFQDFGLFSFDLGQNVAASTEYNEEKVISAIKDAGFFSRFEKLPNGLNTFLYQNFEKEGVEISGGEAQKIAMARAIYKDAPIVVLDEPTAALDPIAEFEIYSHFDKIVGDKTALFISHRLSSCRFCDEIVVFDEGRIVQRGTHNDLVKRRNEKYYELWNAQAQYYVEDNEGLIKEVALT
ncbi:ABC transporter ATP-binding protein [Alkalibacterium olivapovliticus]|uniref:ATP-binding cassette subfamily B protein n=1 Tax=Alkalibacterium olivapovliticus TaxID=99907 RepID=A0A2T0W5N0_9LACT|nr:ABC transporter ATP-binding protein [Alkalibacterium olivapovliticus]PRY81039.1 ATP-binding cassette subfamily B protein [Alkalibacterium olivapovliticus]